MIQLAILLAHRIEAQQSIHQLLKRRKYPEHKEHGGDQVAHGRRALIARIGHPNADGQGEHTCELGGGANEHLQPTHLAVDRERTAGALGRQAPKPLQPHPLHIGKLHFKEAIHKLLLGLGDADARGQVELRCTGVVTRQQPHQQAAQHHQHQRHKHQRASDQGDGTQVDHHEGEIQAGQGQGALQIGQQAVEVAQPVRQTVLAEGLDLAVVEAEQLLYQIHPQQGIKPARKLGEQGGAPLAQDPIQHKQQHHSKEDPEGGEHAGARD